MCVCGGGGGGGGGVVCVWVGCVSGVVCVWVGCSVGCSACHGWGLVWGVVCV